MKKNLAAFRYSDQKVVPLYASEVVRGSYAEATVPADARPMEMACKRAIDVLFSLAVMVLGLPFYGLIALLVRRLPSGRFRQATKAG